MSSRVRKLDDYNEFSRLRKKYSKKRLVIVKFSADWCVPCKEIAPAFERFSLERKSKTLFLELDSDLNEKSIEEYKVERLPTFLFIKNEKVVKRFEGADERKLERYIKRYSGEEVQQQRSKRPHKESHKENHREHKKKPKDSNKPKRTVKYRKHGKKAKHV